MSIDFKVRLYTLHQRSYANCFYDKDVLEDAIAGFNETSGIILPYGMDPHRNNIDISTSIGNSKLSFHGKHVIATCHIDSSMPKGMIAEDLIRQNSIGIWPKSYGEISGDTVTSLTVIALRLVSFNELIYRQDETLKEWMLQEKYMKPYIPYII